MCILFFAIEQHPNYPVIICANRDEFHARPTQTMHFWENEKILAGKDLQAGGTWLGLSPQGRFSALTNFRQLPLKTETVKSRGDLVIQALTKISNQTAKELPEISADYQGFNLIYGQLNNLHCFDSINQTFHPIDKGIHSICNGALDDIWPKMALGQQQLTDEIQANALEDKSLNIEQLFSLMSNEQQALDNQLPRTGIPQNLEQLLSSIFITSAEYGTRTTTIITQNLQGNIDVYNRDYDQKGNMIEKQTFAL
jgi:uncharacterized protein with NRDE domain